MPSGKVFGYLNTYVYDSYGTFSPSVTLSNYAWHGKPSGDVYYNDGDDVDSSYGNAGHEYGWI